MRHDPALGRFLQADSIVPGVARLTPLTVNLGQFVAHINAESRELLQLGAFSLWDARTRQEHHVPMGPANPQVLNRYAYVLNNPLRYVDPTGHWQVRQIELSAEECEQLIEILDTLGDVDFWINLIGVGASVGTTAASLAKIQVPGVISVNSIMLITGVSQPFATLLLAVITAVPAANVTITMNDFKELHDALVKTRAEEYGATISMHQIIGFFEISVRNMHDEVTFYTAVIGVIGSAVPSILGTAMVYDRLFPREYTIYLPYVVR